MTKEGLLESARKLEQVPVEVALEYASKSDPLASLVTATLGGRPELDRLIGPDNASMMTDNHRNHGRFITSILHRHGPEVLVDTVIWVFRAYRAHGFSLVYWPAQLNVWLEPDGFPRWCRRASPGGHGGVAGS